MGGWTRRAMSSRKMTVGVGMENTRAHSQRLAKIQGCWSTCGIICDTTEHRKARLCHG